MPQLTQQLDLFDEPLLPPGGLGALSPPPPSSAPADNARSPLMREAPSAALDAVKAASKPEAPGSIRTLADLQALYDEARSTHKERVAFRSSIQRVGRVLQMPLENIPTAPSELAPMLAKANPALAGIKPKRWQQLRYAVGRAMREADLELIALRDDSALLGEWAALRESSP